MLSVAIFNRQLRKQGQDVSWSRAAFCPCRDPQTGGARQGCPVCRARGVIWAPPVRAYVGLSGMKFQKEWASYGSFESGDVVVSLPSDSPVYAAGENDRVVMVDSSESFDSVHVRGGGFDRVVTAVVRFDRCFWLTPDGSAIVEGGLPAQNPDGTLSWSTGEPPEGTQYTITGRRRPEYFLFTELAGDRAHYGGQAYPRRTVLRKFELFPK